MIQIANSTIAAIVRLLPIVLDNIDRDAMKGNTRLLNAIRQLRIIAKKLDKKKE